MDKIHKRFMVELTGLFGLLFIFPVLICVSLTHAEDSSYVSFKNEHNLEIRFDLFKFAPGVAGYGEWVKSDRYFTGTKSSAYYKVRKGFYTARVIYNKKQYTEKYNLETNFYIVSFNPESGLSIKERN